MREPEAFDPVAYINTPRWQASRLGLERIADLLERMGRPQDRLRFVHVAGTNGKGSTCAYVESVLRCAGYKMGLFTSPYIEAFEERIRVNGENISQADLADVTLFVKRHAEAIEEATGDHPTEFELMTAVALEHFARSGCDIVVLEVGLGGRLDSTNVISSPEVCAIARIGLDHTALLGSTVAEVAAEKAGIIKAGAAVVSWPQEPEAAEVVARAAAEHGCELTVPDLSQLEVLPLGVPRENASREAFVCAKGTERSGGKDVEKNVCRHFTYQDETFTTKLLGRYQPANAALAIEAVRALAKRGWSIPEAAVAEGIARAEWPGRFEVVAASPLTIIDGGHNPQGAAVLAKSLAEVLGMYADAGAGTNADAAHKVVGGKTGMGTDIGAGRKAHFVMGVLADKDYEAMLACVLPLARSFTVYAPANPRALSAEDLAACICKLAERSASAACVGGEDAGGDASDVANETGEGGGTGGVDVAGEVGEADAADVSPPSVRVAPSATKALRMARADAAPEDVVVAFGSLYAIADLKAALR